MGKPFGIHVYGPLQPFVPGFLEELARQRYSPWSATSYLIVMKHLSHWLDRHEWPPAELTPQRVQEFVIERRARGYAKGRSASGMVEVLVSYLRRIGEVPAATPLVPDTLLAKVLDEFSTHLSSQRGLARGTIGWYRLVAQRFLSLYGIDQGVGGYDLDSLTADKINAFILAESRLRSAGSLHNVVTALRALLRFCYLHGHTQMSMAASVLAAPSWRDRGTLRILEKQQVSQLLASCDRQTQSGCRDFAILTLLARLGLRANEGHYSH